MRLKARAECQLMFCVQSIGGSFWAPFLGIEFSLQQRRQGIDKGRGGKGRSPSWNIRRLSRKRLREHLEETRFIDELGWVSPAGLLVATVQLRLISLQMQEKELVSVRDSARWSALTYAMRSIPRGGISASRRWCGKRFQTICCEW